MKDANNVSPFAGKTPQEIRHRWTVWQAQQEVTKPVRSENGEIKREETSAASVAPKEQVRANNVPQAMMKPHHGQYDAVVKRLERAGQMARDYVSSGTMTGKQLVPGSEKAEK